MKIRNLLLLAPALLAATTAGAGELCKELEQVIQQQQKNVAYYTEKADSYPNNTGPALLYQQKALAEIGLLQVNTNLAVHQCYEVRAVNPIPLKLPIGIF